MIGLEERIALTEKVTSLQAQLKEQEIINNDLLKHIKFKCPRCSLQSFCPNAANNIPPLDPHHELKDVETQQGFEQLPFHSSAQKSTLANDQQAESMPHLSEPLPHCSGKKPLNYQQMNFEISSDSETNAPSETNDQDIIDLDGDKLVPWWKIVKQNHPKLLKRNNQRSWEKYVLEFLGKSRNKTNI